MFNNGTTREKLKGFFIVTFPPSLVNNLRYSMPRSMNVA